MDIITMSTKEVKQLSVIERAVNREITHSKAAMVLGLSERSVRRKVRKFREKGAAGLVHANRGRPSNRSWDPIQKQEALLLLSTPLFKGFGPTFSTEKLYELHGIKVSEETVRKAMIQAEIWHKKIKRTKHRKRRERAAAIGIMVQLDGSPHDWFEGRAGRCTLLVFIDDATSVILWMELCEGESTESLFRAARNYFLLHGLPESFYVDYGSVYSVNVNNPERDKLTQFERAMKELGVVMIHASSPQAKGRVERSHKTHQDRLIKELRLANISDVDTANKFIQEVYIPRHNQKFAVRAQSSVNAHRPAKSAFLDRALCIRDKRKLQNDYVISYEKQLLQIHKSQNAIIRPGNEIEVRRLLNGTLKLAIRGIELRFSFVSQRPIKPTKLPTQCFIKRSVHPNSRLWSSGKLVVPQNLRESRVKSATPATEAK